MVKKLSQTDTTELVRIDDESVIEIVTVTPGCVGRALDFADKSAVPRTPRHTRITGHTAVYFAAQRLGLDGTKPGAIESIDDVWAFFDIWDELVEVKPAEKEAEDENPTVAGEEVSSATS